MEHFSQELRRRFPDAVESFDTLEEQATEWAARFARAEKMARYEDRRLRETGDNTARRLIGVFGASLAVRVVDLANGLIALMNTEHVQAAYPVSRATFETAAVPAYAKRNLIPLLEHRRASRAKEMLFRLGLGTDPGLDPTRLPPYRVGQLVSSLAKDADEEFDAPSEADGETVGQSFRRFYSSLSDHTHPNMSAINLASEIGEKGMSWTVNQQLTPGTILELGVSAHLAMWLGGRAFDEVLTAANRTHPLVLPKDDGPPHG